MALGKQLFSEIYEEKLNKTNVPHVKGVYTGNRNLKIACRFHYWYNIKGLKYECVLTVLNQEFDLSETRIAQLIMNARDHIKGLKNDNADRKYLAAKYPYFNWN